VAGPPFIDIASLGDLDGVDDLGDGVEFLPETISTSVIRDSAAYSGVRVTMGARLATAQVKLRLDINFGDPVTPAPQTVAIPALRPGFDPIRVLGYPLETVLAEKLVTALELRQANTRVRDFVDIYLLTGTQAVNCGTLRQALNETAAFRSVQLTPLADATRSLGSVRASNYAAFRRGLGAVAAALLEQFSDTIAAAVAFIDPVIDGLDDEAEWDASSRRWT